jgi:hypothetical protein
MRCKDIQKHLAIDAQVSRLSARVRAHLLECPNCRQAQAIYADIDLQLRDQPAWVPPSGFAERVSLQGLASLGETSANQRSFSSRMLGPAAAASLQPILLGLLTATFCLLVLLKANALLTSYPGLIIAFSRAILDNAIQLAWATGILSLCFSAWVMQRMLR